MKPKKIGSHIKNSLIILLCISTSLISGCAPGISRKGYTLPAGQLSKNTPKHPIAFWCNAKIDTNNAVMLGSIHAYDNGFSTDCDEAAILDIFCQEGSMIGADLINITEEKQPNPLTSTCYRAKADFWRLKNREQIQSLVSDPKYAPDLIVDRSTAAGKRNKQVIIGSVAGGLLGAIIVTAVTEPYHPLSNTNSVPVKIGNR